MIQPGCANTEEHVGHLFFGELIEMCSGLTKCGQVIHDPHRVSVQKQIWCPGICLCGLRSFVHGPGEHK